MNHLPNLLTTGRILATPVIAFLALSQEPQVRYWAFGIFVAAGLSDILDGYLARRLNVVSNLGRLLDPLADKLLLLATLIPIYVISHRDGGMEPLPWWGEMPLWVLIVFVGREAMVTIFRAYAVTRGIVISAGWPGKRKMLLQSLFSGGALLWFPLNQTAADRGWTGSTWEAGRGFLESWVAITLGLACFLTVYSMFHYLWTYRSLLGIRR